LESNDQNFASIVTVFVHTSGIALLSAKFESKKISEIAIAEALIKSMDCQDQTFTLDALKKTLETIIETKNHYVVCVKRNQRKLFSLIDDCIANSITINSTYETNRGHQELRTIRVFTASKEIRSSYPHCKTIILVNRIRETRYKTTEVTIFYISDLTLKAKVFFVGIRGHWLIESRLN